MSKISKFLLLTISSLVFSITIHAISVDSVFSKINYANHVSFYLAYPSTDDSLVIVYQRENESKPSLNRFQIYKSNELNLYKFDLPFTNGELLYIVFGEDQHVDFVISDFYINGKKLENDKIINALNKLGYQAKEKNSLIYAHPTNDIKTWAVDFYSLSDYFVHFSSQELIQHENDEKFLKIIYFLCIFIVIACISYWLIKNRQFEINKSTLYLLFLYAITFSLALGYNNLNHDFSLEQLLLLLKNYLFIFLLPLLLYFLCVLFEFNKYIRTVCTLVSFIFLLIVGVDHFVFNIFGTRFIYSYIGKFAGNIGDGLPFIENYIGTYAGIFYILSVCCIIFLYTLIQSDMKKYKFTTYSCICLCLLSFVLMLLWNNSTNYKYINVFQVNAVGLFTDGDRFRKYENYKPYSIDQLGYKTYTGLNKKENVIVILVESLGCNYTLLCAGGVDYSPYTKVLAQENIWFPNYYSNAYHTNGAIFSITTGLPYIYSDKWNTTPFNKELYQNDVINQFHKFGYETAYFSPAPFIMDKDRQLQLSNYDILSSASDPFYANSKKNGVFLSATDGELFDNIFNKVTKATKPIFYMTTTISTHTPYIIPWGSHNKANAYKYTDQVIKTFIEKLQKINYFDHGIVVITGDHICWGADDSYRNNSQNQADSIELHKVPLIIVNGREHGIVKNTESFSHTSLGVLLEYLMLPEYKKNDFQSNPLFPEEKEYVIHYEVNKLNNVYVKHGEKEDEILLDGDQTRFLGNTFSKEEQEKVLGFISYVRQ